MRATYLPSSKWNISFCRANVPLWFVKAFFQGSLYASRESVLKHFSRAYWLQLTPKTSVLRQSLLMKVAFWESQSVSLGHRCPLYYHRQTGSIVCARVIVVSSDPISPFFINCLTALTSMMMTHHFDDLSTVSYFKMQTWIFGRKDKAAKLMEREVICWKFDKLGSGKKAEKGLQAVLNSQSVHSSSVLYDPIIWL